MSSAQNGSRYPTSANEPRVHPLIRRSFAFVPTVGERAAPEQMLIELFREVFFKYHYESVGKKILNPDEKVEGEQFYSIPERAVLYALRGRRKKARNTESQPFFAPAYPALARNAWLRKKTDRSINGLLLGGAIRQHLWSSGDTEKNREEQRILVEQLVQALIGSNSYTDSEFLNKDILSVALKDSPQVIEENIATQRLLDKTGTGAVMHIDSDPLSYRITRDLKAICFLEANLPRLLWLKVLMTFLRFSLPIWLLAQMRITNYLYEWLIDAVDSNNVPSSQVISDTLRDRHIGLLRPTLTPTREIFEHNESYIKRRVAINILLYNLEEFKEAELKDKQLEVSKLGKEYLTVEQLLQVARDARECIKSSGRFVDSSANTIKDFLTREAEQFHAWRDPLNKGQGKNIDEFFRVLYKDSLGDEDGGYLLVPYGRGRGFRVFPGQLLLKTMTFLAASEKQTNGVVRGGGQLVLGDIEDHFRSYGIDFNQAADARPLLMHELQSMGLLTGSPDAGGSVAVSNPY